ncbi:MAG: hypothetical protein HYZ53_03880 [Planctomycetes bacterium]|nr:hypothetical protein [Planctomycetota bacterium]
MRGARQACLAFFLALSLSSAMGAWAEEPAYQPIRLSFGVAGLESMERQLGLTGELYKLDAVEEVSAEAARVSVQLKSEATLSLSDVVAAAQAASTGEEKLVVDVDGVSLLGSCVLRLARTGKAKDEDVLRALAAAPNVEKAEGAGERWTVRFQGSKGATVGEVASALRKGLAAGTEGAGSAGEAPGVADVSWTAPKAPKKEGGHGCGAGGCGGGGGSGSGSEKGK